MKEGRGMKIYWTNIVLAASSALMVGLLVDWAFGREWLDAVLFAITWVIAQIVQSLHNDTSPLVSRDNTEKW